MITQMRINPRLMDIKGLMAYTSLGKSRAIEFGKASGAIVRFGRRVMYDRVRIDEYIEEVKRSEEGN